MIIDSDVYGMKESLTI